MDSLNSPSNQLEYVIKKRKKSKTSEINYNPLKEYVNSKMCMEHTDSNSFSQSYISIIT